MFVRTQPGIEKLERLIAEARTDGIWEKLQKMESQYRKKCLKCGRWFWINEKLIAKSWFDGSFTGYRCPEPGCGGITKPAEET